MSQAQKKQFVFDMVKEEMGSSVYMREAAWGLLSLSSLSSSSLSSGSSTSCPSSCSTSCSCVLEPAVLVSGEGGAPWAPPPRGCLIPTSAGVPIPLLSLPPSLPPLPLSQSLPLPCLLYPSSLSVPGPCPLGPHSGAPMAPGAYHVRCPALGGGEAEALLHRIEHNMCPSVDACVDAPLSFSSLC